MNFWNILLKYKEFISKAIAKAIEEELEVEETTVFYKIIQKVENILFEVV